MTMSEPEFLKLRVKTLQGMLAEMKRERDDLEVENLRLQLQLSAPAKNPSGGPYPPNVQFRG